MGTDTRADSEKNTAEQQGVQPAQNQGLAKDQPVEAIKSGDGTGARTSLVQDISPADKPLSQEGDKTGAAPHVDQPDNKFDLQYAQRGGINRYLGPAGNRDEHKAVYKGKIEITGSGDAGQQPQLVKEKPVPGQPRDGGDATTPVKPREVPLPPGSQAIGVSDYFKHLAEKWWLTVPEDVRKMAIDSHLKILMVGNARDIPGINPNELARRHKGDKISNLPAFYEPKLGAIVFVYKPDQTEKQIADSAKQTTGANQSFRSPGEDNFVEHAWHELGHGLDYKHFQGQRFTESKEFTDAYNKSLKGLHNLNQNYYSYYVNPDLTMPAAKQMDAAKEETLAQLFALIREDPKGEKRSGGDQEFVRACQPIVEVMKKHHLI